MSDNSTEYRTQAEELRVSEGAQTPTVITGYAARFDSDSNPIPPGFIERIQKGAFKKALEEGQDVRALVEHDKNQLLGRVSSGTLKLWEDDKGLRFELTPPNTELGRSVRELVKRGDIRGMSFGFREAADKWNFEGDVPQRALTSIGRLIDVSAVLGDPAYSATTAEVRSHVEGLLSNRSQDASDTPETTGNETDNEVELRLAMYEAQLNGE